MIFLTVLLSDLQNRTDVQCQHRWQKVLNPELIKGPWTKEEDQRVRPSSAAESSRRDQKPQRSTEQLQEPDALSA